jgi:hypothetical protein
MNHMVQLTLSLPEQFLPLDICSELRTKDPNNNSVVYRTTPSFRSTNNWTDWAFVKIHGGSGTTTIDHSQTFDREERHVTRNRIQRFEAPFLSTTRPTELFGFFTFPPHDTPIILANNVTIPVSDQISNWCIGRSLKLNPILDGGLQHPSSTILYWSKKSLEFTIFPISDVIAPCLVIPDLDIDQHHSQNLVPTDSVTVIGPRHQWSTAFIQLANDLEEKDRSNQPDRIDYQIS